MGTWIMSIVGVICLGVLLEIVLPEGQTAKYVKGAFSLLVVFVIAAPLPGLLKKDFKLDIDNPLYEVDEEYVVSTYGAYADSICTRTEYLLKAEGYDTKVALEFTDERPVKIRRIGVEVYNFKQTVSEAVSAEIKSLISGYLKCSESAVDVKIIDIT